MKRIYIYMAIGAVLAVSCRKADVSDAEHGDTGTEQVQSSPIRFSVSDISLTRSGISEISDIKGNIHIRGTRGSSVLKNSDGSESYENIGIVQDSNTGLWTPQISNPATWQYENIEKRELLDSTKNPPVSFNPKQYKEVKVINNKYSFSAYAFNDNVPEGVTAPAPVLATSGDEFGMRIKGLSQPETYVHPTDGKPFGYDYVLSNRYDVSTQKTGNKIIGDVVKFHMEHALASVNVKLVVSKHIKSVKLQGIKLEGFYRTADMTCTSQALYGSGDRNVWVSENLKNLNQTPGYLRGVVNNPEAAAIITVNPDPQAADDYTEVLLLDFCAIPQLLTKNCKLTVDLLVQQREGGADTPIHQVWDLSHYEDWECGQRNIYVIKINSASEILATFDSWTTAYEVTGTILP